MTPVEITAGTYVTSTGWNKAYRVNTVDAMIADYSAERAEAILSRCDPNERVFSINAGSCISSDVASNKNRAEQDVANKASAVVLENGQAVKVDGRWYAALVRSERFSDPIGFRLLKSEI